MKKSSWRLRYGSPVAIRDIPQDEKIVLVTDSQDASAIKEHLGGSRKPSLNRFDSFFVECLEGCYGRIWGFEGTVPYLNKPATPIYRPW